MSRRDANGKLVRPPRPDVPAFDLTTVAGIVEMGRFWSGQAANIAGFCMSDHLDDEGVVRDCHDIIGNLGAIQSAFQLLEARAVLKAEVAAERARIVAAIRAKADLYKPHIKTAPNLGQQWDAYTQATILDQIADMVTNLPWRTDRG